MNQCPYCGSPTRMSAADVVQRRGCGAACQQAFLHAQTGSSSVQVCPLPRKPPPLIRPEQAIRQPDRNTPEDSDHTPEATRLSALSIALGSVGLLLFLMTGLVIVFVMGRKTFAPTPPVAETVPVKLPVPAKATTVAEAPSVPAAPVPAATAAPAVTPPQATPAAAVAVSGSPPPKEFTVFESLDLEHPGGGLTLPAQALTTLPFRDLATLHLKSPDDLTVELLGGDVVFKEGYHLELAPPRKTSDGDREFPVRLALASAGASAAALFRLKANSLQFQWNNLASERAGNLRYCRLRLHSGDETRVCSLSAPVVLPAPALDLSVKESSITLPLPGAHYLDESRLSFSVQIVNPASPDEILPEENVPAGLKQTLVLVKSPEPMGMNGLELDLKLEQSVGQFKVSLKPFSYRADRTKAGTEEVVRAETWSARLKSIRDTNTRGLDELKGKQARLERKRREYQKDETASQAQLTQLRTQQSTVSAAAATQRIALIESQLEAAAGVLVKEQEAIDQDTAYFEAGKAWCEKMSQDFEALQGREVQISVYLSIGKEPADKICLLTTGPAKVPAKP